MAEQRPDKIQEEIQKQNTEVNSSNELVFDPQSGKLVVKQPNETLNPDATVVTQIATDGFALKLIP